MTFICDPLRILATLGAAGKPRLRTLALSFGVFLISTTAGWACGDACGKPTPWDDFNVFRIRMTQPGQAAYALWRGQFDKESNDIQIEAEISDGKSVKTGKILMVGGRVMATNGDLTTPGYEIDALDAPVLQRLLVTHILGVLMPNGTVGLTGTRKIDFTEPKTGIQLATQSAEAFFQAPWHVQGAITLAAGEVVDFDLGLTAGLKSPTPDRRIFTAKLSGRLSKSAKARIDDAMGLHGWKLFGLGIQSSQSGNTTTMDYNAAPATEQYKTIGDIRKKLTADDFPGERDSSKDFTGLWKEKCDDSFGLQIMHAGSDGQYSIAFCGVGGCEDASETRKTFFTGDRHYQVVSEDKIVEIYDSAPPHTMLRCSKDPHAWQKLGATVK
jgi:hypothetical protein